MTSPETNDKGTAVAQQGTHAAPERASSKKGAVQKTGPHKAKKTAKVATPKKLAKGNQKPAKSERARATAPRAESKGAKILEMTARAKGATLAEMMKATGWQAHSVRGFISAAAKKHKIEIESLKNHAGAAAGFNDLAVVLLPPLLPYESEPCEAISRPCRH